MKQTIFIVFSIILLLAFCYCGVKNDTYEKPIQNNAKVVHETVTVYY